MGVVNDLDSRNPCHDARPSKESEFETQSMTGFMPHAANHFLRGCSQMQFSN
jgi:hypothetical protein